MALSDVSFDNLYRPSKAFIQKALSKRGLLPPSAFRLPALKEGLRLELDGVLLSLQAKDYKAAQLVLQNVILPQTNGCATTGAPDRNDWIINCPDQSMVYTPLLNIIAQVKALAATGG
jgi:hypothetical protein